MERDRPKIDDAVLGNQHSPPPDGVVLGGLEGVKRRLANASIEQKKAALKDALNYGEAGLDLVIQALENEPNRVKLFAYSLLQNREEAKAKAALPQCNIYQFFECLNTLEEHFYVISRVCPSSDGKTLYSGSADLVREWNWQTGEFQNLSSTTSDSHLIYDICLSSDGLQLFITHRREGVEIRDLLTKKISGILREKLNWDDYYFPKYTYNSTIVSDDKLTLFSIISYLDYYDGGDKIQVWNLKTKSLIGTLTEAFPPVCSLAIGTDGKTLFSSDRHDTIKIWDWQAEKLIGTLEGHDNIVSSLCLSPDGQTLFSGSYDGTIKVWDWQARKLLQTLKDTLDDIRSIAISPDGMTLFSGGGDRKIRIWNWKTGEMKGILTGHTDAISALAISVDGSTLFSGSWDNTIKVWGVP